MSVFVLLDQYGKTAAQMRPSDDASFLEHRPNALLVVEPLEHLNYRMADGALVELPPKPNPYCMWQGEWIDPRALDELRDAAKVQVTKERDLRGTSPILYDGRMVDSDADAQRNINIKLGEIEGRLALALPMPQELMVWRDADNEVKVFATMDEMRAWLQGLTVAIAQRGTMTYAWSWQVKAALEAATTGAELAQIVESL